MKQTIFFLLSIAAFSFKSNAQVYGNYGYNTSQGNRGITAITHAQAPDNNEISFSVNGLMNVVPDQFIAVFNLVQVGETASTTDELMNNRIRNFIGSLGKIGIDTSMIKTDLISFVPKYEFQEENRIFSKTYNEIPSGFELQKNVRVSYSKATFLDVIMSAAANVEIYDLVKVDYFVTDMQKVYNTLRDKCVNAMMAKVKTYDMLGFRLDTLKKSMAEDYRSIYPPERYNTYQGFCKPSMDAIKRKNILGSPNKINKVDMPQSRYYAQVNYNDYDIVINPDIREPEVQFSYSITVKYFLKDDSKIKNRYFVITPQGDTKAVFEK